MTPLQVAPSLGPPLLQISPFGVIPKKNRPDKWRLFVDLSSPAGQSVNGAISQGLCSVSYALLNQVVQLAQSLGRGALLVKLDLQETYRAVPVHPSDQHFLAVSWKGTPLLALVTNELPLSLQSETLWICPLVGMQ